MNSCLQPQGIGRARKRPAVNRSTAGDLDQATLEAAIAGDRAAVTRFMEHVEPALLGVAKRRATGGDIEDLVQDAWLAVLAALPRVDATRGTANIRSWAFVVARCGLECRRWNVIRHAAGGDAMLVVNDGDYSNVGRVERVDADQDARTEARAALARMRAEDRAIVLDVVCGGETIAEVASRLGEPYQVLEYRIKRALAEASGVSVRPRAKRVEPAQAEAMRTARFVRDESLKKIAREHGFSVETVLRVTNARARSTAGGVGMSRNANTRQVT